VCVSCVLCRWAPTFSLNNAVSLDYNRLLVSRGHETTDNDDHGTSSINTATVNCQNTRPVSFVYTTYRVGQNKCCQILVAIVPAKSKFRQNS